MNMDRVTITGADDSMSVDDLVMLSVEFPFVEWGILVSKNSTGSPRFPSMRWIQFLKNVMAEKYLLNLSLHLCGHWVRQLLLGINEIPENLVEAFQRIQLNFHAENTPCDPPKFFETLLGFGNKQFIFQIDGNGGNRHLNSVLLSRRHDRRVDAVPLFDVSSGAGILPERWPGPNWVHGIGGAWMLHGYAGGLGPCNLAEQLPLIEAASDGCPFWIDCETRVRSRDDKQFDLAKVRRFLEIAKPHVKGN